MNYYKSVYKKLSKNFSGKGFRKLFNRKRNKVVYTAITGDYDELLTPFYVNNDWDYICFTDNNDLKSDFWQIRKMKDLNLDNIKKARNYKILPHVYLPEYQYSLWVDGNFRIVGDINEYITKFSNDHAMICILHPGRICIYDEAEACIKQKKDAEKIIRNQMKEYRSKEFPEDQGLIASGVLFRKHNNQDVKDLMNAWWYELELHSRRDQLSFDYVCWKNGFEYAKCDLNYWKNEYFERIDHK
jgi:hypothetical protein